MCILVWMKITQNRPDQNIILFSSFCLEHFMYIFQILCSRQSEVLKQWDVQCQSSIDWRFLYCSINIWWQRSWSGQVTQLKWPSYVWSEDHVLLSNFSHHKNKKRRHCRRCVVSLGAVTALPRLCQGCIDQESTGAHTKVEGLSLHSWQHHLCHGITASTVNYGILQSQGCIFANS